VESERQTGHFGQPGRPVVPAGDDLLQFAHRGGRLRLGRLAPVSVPPGSARQAGYDQPGRVRAGTFVRLHDWIIADGKMIKHGRDKRQLALSPAAHLLLVLLTGPLNGPCGRQPPPGRFSSPHPYRSHCPRVIAQRPQLLPVEAGRPRLQQVFHCPQHDLTRRLADTPAFLPRALLGSQPGRTLLPPGRQPRAAPGLQGSPAPRRACHRPGRHLARPPGQAPRPRSGPEPRLAQAPHRGAEPAEPGRTRPDPPRRRLGPGHLTSQPGPGRPPARPGRHRRARYPWPQSRKAAARLSKPGSTATTPDRRQLQTGLIQRAPRDG